MKAYPAFMAFGILALLAAWSSSRAQSIVHSADWYASHPTQRFQVATLCKNWPAEAQHNPNCENAFQGGLVADARSVQAKMGGVSNLGGPDISYWRSHPENRDFWANQCRMAMARHASAETLAGMWCPAVLASGG